MTPLPRACGVTCRALVAFVGSVLLAAPGEPRAEAAGASARRSPVVLAVEKAGPGVVNISTEQILVGRGDPFFAFRDPYNDDLFREWFERFPRPRHYHANSLGSGVLIDPDGYIVTNDHVVRRASKIHVTLSDGGKYEGRLLSTDADSDLALIKVDAPKPLPTVPMGHSDDLMIGESVIALGNPFGLESTVTVGIVSAKNRSVMLRGQEAYAGLIQTDAAINPGNSGGALVNIEGELIGINVAIHAQAQGIGFAIPADKVRAVLAGLFDYRLVKKTYTGIRAQDVGPTEARKYGIALRSGALIVGVDDASPAAKAGLQAQDVITGMNDAAVTDLLTFYKQMLKKGPGDEVTLQVLHQGKPSAVRLTVAKLPKVSGEQLARRKLGVTFQAMNQEVARSFGLRQPQGLLITEVEENGAGGKAGLRRGDILLRFGPYAVNTLEQLSMLLEQVEPGIEVSLVVFRGRAIYRALLSTR